MHFVVFFIAGMCLSSATEAIKLTSVASDGHNAPDPASGVSNRVPNFSISGSPPAFTEVITLVKPDLVQCAHRLERLAFILNEVGYMASKTLPEYLRYDNATGEIVPNTYSWLHARNECRKRCMELVSLDTLTKFKHVSQMMVDDEITEIWTSGRLCDFKGCEERFDLHPLNKKGWFWANKKSLPPIDTVPVGFDSNPWSPTGQFNRAQPDQAELLLSGKRESCIALLNNLYDDGVKMHDVACHLKKQFMCEDSPVLVKFMEEKYNYELPDLSEF